MTPAEILAAPPVTPVPGQMEMPMPDPLIVHWNRTVIHPGDTSDDTIVCCLTDDGTPVALLLNDELREALGAILIDPDGDQS